ncbi:hypothetical protein ACGF0J_17550 [Nonomuraea sp. NPDC047897]|uniref:hypothetical protein n=1 Tax=Nonomuraea sp. NPDC047897 TaxID=3364346 RepID=UPI003721A8FB
MARTRATAVSAMVLALGLTAIGSAPFVGQSASATVVALDPEVPPCEADEACEPTEVTVTVTTTPPEPTEDPETTVTRTVTQSAKPTRTASPTPTKTKTKTAGAAPTTPPAVPSQDLDPIPSQSVEVPLATPPAAETTPEDTVSLPAVAGTETPLTQPSSSPLAEETSSGEPVQLEVRNASPEFDQQSLTRQLSIPALILVLLTLFAVLIFEGRLRRVAHAAAVRRAGPQPGGPDLGGPGLGGSGLGGPGLTASGHPAGPGGAYPGHPAGPGGAYPGMPGGAGYPGHPTGHGYPAGPGYTVGYPTAGYPGGPAYAPIISFVPVQTYPGGEVQYSPVYQEPSAPAFVPEEPAAPPAEAVVLHPDDFDSYSHEPAPERPEGQRGFFEPLVPPEVPPADIPAGGAAPYDGSPELPVSSASGAETGDSEPWQASVPPSDADNRTRPEHLPPVPPPGDGEQATVVGQVPAGGQETVEQPLPEQDKGKRGFWRRAR